MVTEAGRIAAKITATMTTAMTTQQAAEDANRAQRQHEMENNIARSLQDTIRATLASNLQEALGKPPRSSMASGGRTARKAPGSTPRLFFFATLLSSLQVSRMKPSSVTW